MKKLILTTALTILTLGFVNAQCNASWSASVNGGATTFTNTSTGNPDYYYWDFGDGNYAYTQNANHTYQYDGTYIVCLYIQGDSITNPNCYSQFCDSVVITGQGSPANCNATFTAYSATYEVNDAINFNSSGSVGTNYWWDFGDGNGSSSANPTHYYNAAGVYTVCLLVGDNVGCVDTVCQSLTIVNTTGGWGSCNVTSSVYYHPPTNELSGNVATSTAATHLWNVYDASFNLVHSVSSNFFSYYPTSNGTHYVVLEGLDSNGNWCDTAMVNANVSNAGSGTGCSVNGTASYNAGANEITGTITSSTADFHTWMVYDPNLNMVLSSSNNSFVYTPTMNGNYLVLLEGLDSNGNYCDSAMYSINVTNASGASACNADFAWWEDSSATSPIVLMFNLSSGNNLSYTWDFGDGTTSNLAYPTHTYLQDGIYLVCLTVDDGNGCTDTYCDSVTYVIRANGYTINVIDPANDIDENEVTISGLYPNPVEDELNLNMNVTESGPLTVLISDVNGKIVYQEGMNAQFGENQLKINTDFEGGLYFLTVQSANGQATTSKFIKK
jgi:PKD repeat protein